MFASAEHHDAHELFNFLVNDIADTLLKYRIVPPEQGSVCCSAATAHPDAKTWVHHMLEGNLVCETRCRRCDNVTKREEPFLDLSVDIQNNSTLKVNGGSPVKTDWSSTHLAHTPDHRALTPPH
eukprot:GHVN01106743.1.p1 GENE.GHVN01106743.1~~GHVN01106743.1.p1  ORF type:complete len:124 (+),score=21.80 GHVN01106743.1:593-964(+)